MNASCSASTGESAANSHLPVSLRSREGAASGLTLQYEPKVNPVVLTAAHTYTHTTNGIAEMLSVGQT